LAAPLIGRPLGWTGYALGVVLGLLPCGVVYAALMVAASTGHALTAALGMLAFALGTMPGLGVVGWIGQTAVAGWAWPLRHAPVILLAANAAAALAVTVR
jgi:sulfite exporter TauE/SafE